MIWQSGRHSCWFLLFPAFLLAVFLVCFLVVCCSGLFFYCLPVCADVFCCWKESQWQESRSKNGNKNTFDEGGYLSRRTNRLPCRNS